MKKKLVYKLLTNTNLSLLNTGVLFLRCTIGFILFIVGAGKVLGWFGGMGMDKTLQIFVSNMHIPVFLVYLSSYTEFLGGLLLILGLITRPAAFAVTINMAVATLIMWPRGFITGGADFPFTLMMIVVIILLAGPMDYSLDNLFFRPDQIISELTDKDITII